MTCKDLKVLQCNLNHCKNACDELSINFIKYNSDIVLIQEPYCTKNIVRYLKNAELVYDKKIFGININQPPRTVIMYRRGLNVFVLNEFCSRDMVTIKLRINNTTLVLCSVYVENGTLNILNQLKELKDSCKAKNLQLIIGGDFNAHHINWGSADNNYRGEKVMDFIISTELTIQNLGSKPTFVRTNCSTIIDLTLTTQFIGNKIKNWHVIDDYTGSDHKYIQFVLSLKNCYEVKTRHPRKTNWEKYQETLTNDLKDIKTNFKNVVEFEYAANKLSETIISAFHKNCVEQTVRTNRNVSWWNNYLAKSRSTIRKLEKTAYSDGLKGENKTKERNLAIKVYKTARNKYMKEVKRAKKTSWKHFNEEVKDIQGVAKIHKLLSKDHTNPIGTLKKSDDSYTKDVQDTLELLTEIHFPGREILIDEMEEDLDYYNVQLTTSGETTIFFHEEQVKWAIASFKPFKAPGVDGIFPALLQQAPKIVANILCEFYNFSLKSGYLPLQWRKANIVFIPKTGKKPNDLPKSFRPITLSSFLLKTMEKMISHHIKKDNLSKLPLNTRQFAYQEGKSTSMALKSTVSQIQKSLDNQKIAIGLSVDIEGAFDNTKYDVIKNGLIRKEVDPFIISWISNMLRCRLLKTEIAGETICFSPTKGCPQGGILSPLLWTIVIDELLCILNNKGFKTDGFADDLFILILGSFFSTTSDLVQQACNTIQGWCNDVGLSVNPDKVNLTVYTRKRKRDGYFNPIFFGKEIVPAKEIKYLGVILDEKLTWESHIKFVANKALCSLFTCKKMVGKKWGLSPSKMKWIYTGMVRPILLYASFAWYKKASSKCGDRYVTHQKLQKVQRTALLMITGGMSTTPTDAMEAMLNLPPLFILIEGEAIMDNYRCEISELKEIRSLVDTTLNIKIEKESSLQIKLNDHIKTQLNLQPKYSVEIPDREKWRRKEIILDGFNSIWYTDGSKTEEGVGLGVHGCNTNLYKSLGKYMTVFQAEMLAILTCVEKLLDEKAKELRILICSDSQAVLKALLKDSLNSSLTRDCCIKLNELANQNKVVLCWIPGHCGIEGNETVDKLAKKGALLKFIGPEPFTGISLGLAKYGKKNWIQESSTNYWKNVPKLRQSKVMINQPEKERENILLSLNRSQLRVATMLLTGHGIFKNHMYKMKLVEDQLCRFCSNSYETSLHLICFCSRFEYYRCILFGDIIIQPSYLHTYSFKDLMLYFKLSGLLATLIKIEMR